MARAGWHYRHPVKGGRHEGTRKIPVDGTVVASEIDMDANGSRQGEVAISAGNLDKLSGHIDFSDAPICHLGGADTTLVMVDGSACMWLSFLPLGTGKERMDTDYLKRFFGGRISSRITIPMIDSDGIMKAADALHELSHKLREVAVSRDRKLTKLLSARSAIYSAHTKLRVEGIKTDGRPTDSSKLQKRLGATTLRTIDK
jgi:hypothetical protein